MDDPISPNHYNREDRKIGVLDVVRDWKLNFYLENVVKYLYRWEMKGGIADLRKAEVYLRKFIEWEEEKGE